MVTKVISSDFISLYALMISEQFILKLSDTLNDYKRDIKLLYKSVCTNDISTVYLKAILVYDYKSDIMLLHKCVPCTNDISAVYLEDIS